MKDELLPCPFCGEKAESDSRQPFRHYRTGAPLEQPAVYCTSCSATISHYPGDLGLDRRDTMSLVVEAWNTRVQPQPAPVAKVRVTSGGYAMSLAQYVAYALPEGDHWLYAHPPTDRAQCMATLQAHADALAGYGTIVEAHFPGEQAPNHAHTIPGVWDEDNDPEKSGKPCEWCAQYAGFRRALRAYEAFKAASHD